MGILKLKLMAMQRQKRRRQIQARNGSIASRTNMKGSPCQQGENSLGDKVKGYSQLNLPQDIWCHIHSLMPMRYAARVACVSRAFLRSWRCHPNLIFTEESLGLNRKASIKDEKAKDFTSKVDRILRNHSGIGVKKLKLRIASAYNRKECFHHDHVNSWLQIAIKPGIEELNLCLSLTNTNYNLPCSLLSDRTGDSLRYLRLASCNFHPTVGFGCLRNLTRLQLFMVCITGDELWYLLSSSFSLEQLELSSCTEIICLKIPCMHQLSYLEVLSCTRLQVIESKAPNLSGFRFAGDLVQLSLGDTLPMRKLDWFCSDAPFYACTEFPSSMPNLEILTIYSRTKMVNTPMLADKFLHLKLLSVAIGGPAYDYLSLVLLVDAAPSLKTFILTVQPGRMGHVSVFADPSDPRRMPEQCHSKLKRVKIINFSSAKSLVELTCHILESTKSLKHLTLDTTQGFSRCSVNKSGKCLLMRKGALWEAQKALLAFQTYIKPKVPSKVKLRFLEPCIRCHVAEL